jgi:hypothetical protein
VLIFIAISSISPALARLQRATSLLPGFGVSPSGIAKGGQPFAGVRGVPEKIFFLLFLAATGGEKKKIREHPYLP